MKPLVNGYTTGVWHTVKTPEISCLPVWVNLKSIHDSYFTRLGISHILSGLGEPMLKHNSFRPNKHGKDKIFVENEMDSQSKHGNIYLVDVEYSSIPTTCERCGVFRQGKKVSPSS
ncbi:hypothetical protein DY000_02038830 [Brassica cretica]|uniref:DUF4283 domain-containing protein n=1 Tax=Brassica cretica TaxID=69181 RepID=A0ABQ7BJ37_BRACR|nr:hypothetical protein DY000_02038830 [Brassica cretica]